MYFKQLLFHGIHYICKSFDKYNVHICNIHSVQLNNICEAFLLFSSIFYSDKAERDRTAYREFSPNNNNKT